MSPPKPLAPAELRAHPSLNKLVVPEPTSTGKAQVGKAPSASVLLQYRLYGNGPIKILWNNGHGASMTTWRRQMFDFGLSDPEKYTSCFYSYRNYEKSNGSWSWSSPRTAAEDALKLLDHLGWTAERQVHVVGFSYGGYVAQNIALLATRRLASLTLTATTCCVADSFTPSKVASILADAFPRSEASQWQVFKRNLFGPEWVCEVDEEGLFPTNGDRIIAEEILTNEGNVNKGAFLQMPGAYMHNITDKQLAEIGSRVGHDRVQVIHGFHDKLLPLDHGRRLHGGMGGDDKGVRLHVIKRAAHMAIVEQRTEFKEALKGFVSRIEEPAIMGA